MALVGEGADELFGGYPTYIGAGIAEKFANLPAWIRNAIRRGVESLPVSEKKMTVSFLLKRFVQGAELGGMTRHELWMSNIPPQILARLGVPPSPSRADDHGDGLLLDRVQRWDLESFLAEGLLTKADRASMTSALELRAPFLDEAVMAFAASLPAADRVRNFSTKIFLKNYALRYLPKSIVHRRKRGLSVPIGRWLRGPLRDWAPTLLGNPRLEQIGVRRRRRAGIIFRALPAPGRPRAGVVDVDCVERMARLGGEGNRRRKFVCSKHRLDADLHLHLAVGRALVIAGQRRHVGVVAADGDLHIGLVRLAVVRRVERDASRGRESAPPPTRASRWPPRSPDSR